MITIQYTTSIKGIPIKAVIEANGDGHGKLQIVVASVDAAGLSLFGILKAQAAQEIANDLKAQGLSAIQTGSTVTVSLPGVQVQKTQYGCCTFK